MFVHHETLESYLRDVPEFTHRVLPSTDSSKILVDGVSRPELFQGLRYSVFRYYEEQGYACVREEVTFNPDSRTLVFKNSQQAVAFKVKLLYESDNRSKDGGRAHITREVAT